MDPVAIVVPLRMHGPFGSRGSLGRAITRFVGVLRVAVRSRVVATDAQHQVAAGQRNQSELQEQQADAE